MGPVLDLKFLAYMVAKYVLNYETEIKMWISIKNVFWYIKLSTTYEVICTFVFDVI